MTRELSEADKWELLLHVGLLPLQAFPGSGEPWLCACAECQREITIIYGEPAHWIHGNVCEHGA